MSNERLLEYTTKDIIAGRQSPFARRLSNPTPTFKPTYDTGLEPQMVGKKLRNVKQNGQVIYVAPGENIQKAIDIVNGFGGGTVILGVGTHIVNYDIILYSHISIIGENAIGSIVNFSSNSNQFKVVGSGAYATGTLSVSNGGTAVTGSSTFWSTNAVAGQYILLGGGWYPIAVVGGDTSITISVPFGGTTLSGASYTIATIIQGVRLTNFEIKNSATAALKIQYANEITINEVNWVTNNSSMDFDTCSNMSINQLDITADTLGANWTDIHYVTLRDSIFTDVLSGAAVTLNSCTAIFLGADVVLNSAGDGYNITSCDGVVFSGGQILECGGQGIELVATNTKVVVGDVEIQNSASDGIKLTASSDNCFIKNCILWGNGGYGLNIAASTCDTNLVIGNNFSGNVTAAASDSGTGTLIRSNIGLADN